MIKISFQRQVFLGLLLALLIVFGINFFSWIGIDEYKKNEGLITHTQEVMNTSDEVLIGVLNAETGQRGYLLTGRESYLEPYREAVSSVAGSLAKLSKLVSDNPAQVIRVDSLKELVTAKRATLEYTLVMRREKGDQAARDFVLTDKGKILSQQIRSKVREIGDEERRLLEIRKAAAADTGYQASRNIIIGATLVFLVLAMMLRFILRTFKMQKAAETRVKESNVRLMELSNENARQNWLLTGTDRVNEQLRGEHTVETLGEKVLGSLCTYFNARVGAFYLFHEENTTLEPSAGYALSAEHKKRSLKLGEGLLGQAASEQRVVVLEEVPENYMKVESALGEMSPSHILIAPFSLGKDLKAVIELGFTGKTEARRKDLLNLVGESIAIAIQVAQARESMRRLLEQVQLQSEELETQQEELRQTNEELSRQTELLQASEEELRVQQEELRQTNSELEEKASLLEEKNVAVEEAREAMVQKAHELELTNRYKSEFLANMSHELRTPLNSILILAELIGANRKGHLDEEEVKYARVVFNAGSDLLTLINDILDLSKIESGKLELEWGEASLAEIASNMEQLFTEVAGSKGVVFETFIDPALPKSMETDRQRLEQIIRNLLSNAFKFTPEGGKVNLSLTSGNKSELAISVKDTGIGIPRDKLDVIFEAFKQADGSTNRRYGGTGLGLSISRELAQLLGGRIELESKEDEGSTFRLIVPLKHSAEAPSKGTRETADVIPRPRIEKVITQLSDDRMLLGEEDKTILVVEDDPSFAGILQDYAHRKGFKVIVAHDGKSALEMAREFLPDAIILDIMLPLMDGWEVLRQLKADTRLRTIPVHVMSAADSNGAAIRNSGAISFNRKPVERDTLETIFTGLEWNLNPRHNKVLLVEDQHLQSDLMREALTAQGFLVDQAFDGKGALKQLEENAYDCLILDLNLPDTAGLDLLARIKEEERHAELPVIINTASDLSPEMHAAIMKYSNALVMKSKRSNERLLDEIKLFMNKVKTEKPVPKAGRATQSKTMEKTLKDKKVLLVDDDMRNIFALSSALQHYQLKVEIASNGAEALEKMKEHRDFDLVLMDVMMPEMDGYEAMKRIRQDAHYGGIPVIALTAKAMKNDREKCLEAGASDYIPKPVDMEKLLSMMRVWLSR